MYDLTLFLFDALLIQTNFLPRSAYLVKMVARFYIN